MPNSQVKYHLVEAEEVSKSPITTTSNAKSAPHFKKNGTKIPLKQFMMQTNHVKPSTKTSAPKKTNKHKHKNNRHYRGNGKPRVYQDEKGTYMNGMYIPNNDLNLTAQWAKAQIEFYFTADNLVRDTFLRKHMDVKGYVPLAFVASFQAVFAVHQDYESLVKMFQNTPSEYVEFDAVNEKIRVIGNWQTWLWPNGNGGYGVPEYIKLSDSNSKNSPVDKEEPNAEDDVPSKP